MRKKKKKQQKPQKKLRGTLSMNPRGFGFILPDESAGLDEDVFIARGLTHNAVNGDSVEFLILGSSEKGLEGKITRVLERGKSTLGGTVFAESKEFYLLHCPLLGPDKHLFIEIASAPRLEIGDRVIATVLDWGDDEVTPICSVQQILGNISDASFDIQAATEEFQIPVKFPEEVVAQAKKFGPRVSAKDCKSRLNFTQEECFTIDPTTAKDFDDALSLSQDAQGCYKLGVHIADVAHYVQPNTPLDTEAQKRGNSTYFPGACVPMLPEELSNHLCSLKPKVVRLCISVFMTFSPTGDLLDHSITRTFIKSAKRFTYEEAKKVLDSKKKSPHKETLHRMVELCHLLKAKRSERGSVDFSMPEVVLKIDPQGNPTGYEIIEYDITHQLVEEFMLKANEIVAKALTVHDVPLIFRIHEHPDASVLDAFFMLARSLGFPLPKKPTQKDVQKLFIEAKASPFAEQLSVAFIRSMKLASYSCDNIGHYGLALEHYCHFTSPIRRYPDLIIQRLLCNEMPKELDTAAIASHCSKQERISFKAEQTVKNLKKLRLLKQWHEEDPNKIYNCRITKIKPFGIHFELPPIGIEGFFHVSEIGSDYFVYEPEKNSLLGRHTHIRFCIGDTIRAGIDFLDLISLNVSWVHPQQKEGRKKFPKRR